MMLSRRQGCRPDEKQIVARVGKGFPTPRTEDRWEIMVAWALGIEHKVVDEVWELGFGSFGRSGLTSWRNQNRQQNSAAVPAPKNTRGISMTRLHGGNLLETRRSRRA